MIINNYDDDNDSNYNIKNNTLNQKERYRVRIGSGLLKLLKRNTKTFTKK